MIDDREHLKLTEQIIEALNRGQSSPDFANHCLRIGKYMQPLEGESRDIFDAVTRFNNNLSSPLLFDGYGTNFYTWKKSQISLLTGKADIPSIDLETVVDCWYLIGRQIYRNLSEAMNFATELGKISDPTIAREAANFFQATFKYGDPGENENYLAQLKSAYEIAGDLVATRKYDPDEMKVMRRKSVSLKDKITQWEYFRLDPIRLKPGSLSEKFNKLGKV